MIRRNLCVFFATVALLFGLIPSSCGHSSTKKNSALSALPVYKLLPVLMGKNYTGSFFSSDSLKGRIWVAYFFFTSCGGPCPAMNTVVADLDKKWGDRVRFVGISVDPETDSPEVMSAYIRRFTDSPRGWAMLTMPKDSVIKIAATGFMLGSKEEPELHSTRLVLIDEESNIRGYYDGMDSTAVQALNSILRDTR
jgi:protein SCO1